MKVKKTKIEVILCLIVIGILLFGVNVRAESLTTITDINKPINVGKYVTSIEIQRYNQTWLDFDGINDYASLNYTLCNLNKGFTLGAWAKHADNLSSGGYIFSLGNSSLMSNFLGITKMFSSKRMTINTQNKSGYGISSNSGLYNNETENWHHYVLTYNGYTIRLYIDSKLQASLNKNLESEYTCFDKITIGALGRRINNLWYNGSINEFFLTNYSLNQNQINEIYNRSIHNKGLGMGIPILYYHNIGLSWTSISLENFTRQMHLLNESGYKTINTRQLLDWMDKKINLPEKSVVIQFDDGYVSSIVNGFPVMEKYNYTGSLNVITQFVPKGKSNSFANWTLLKDILSKGWEINSHSLYHNHTLLLSYEQRIENFNKSKWEIYKNLGFMPYFWVYPYNEFNSTISDECISFYEGCSGGSFWSSYNYKPGNKKVMKRMGMGDDVYEESLKNILNIYRNEISKLNIKDYNNSKLFDSSTKENNGQINGATWKNDEILITLKKDYDYKYNSGTGDIILLNPELDKTYVIIEYYSYQIDKINKANYQNYS